MAHIGSEKLMRFYQALLDNYGPQHWWPGETPFEVMVGAVLTQNTSWLNVEKAIAQLKTADKLTPQAINALAPEQLAQLIRPAGYFNIKALRLKNLIGWFCDECGADIAALAGRSVDSLREDLLAINGVGRETADSIILYALNKATFVVDSYTFRILVRHGCIDGESDYEQIKEYMEAHLANEVGLYNEFHALIVRVGKEHCKPRARCDGCPLEQFEHGIEETP